jgi:hypothetical protein
MRLGFNVAKSALGLIGKEQATYYRCTGRTTNEIGLDVSSFTDPVTVRGSWQPIPKNTYQDLGLDLQKTYVTWITCDLMQDIGRDESGDQVEFQGKRYQVYSATPWGDVAGFSKYTLVQIPNEGGA